MDVMKTHGAFSWSELTTTDPAKAVEFYGKLFAWKVEKMDMPQGAYHVGKVGDASICGIMSAPPGAGAMPPHWGVYVTVTDVDATAKDCVKLGGKLCMGPHDIPGVGRMVVLQDPQGAFFSAITYNMS